MSDRFRDTDGNDRATDFGRFAPGSFPAQERTGSYRGSEAPGAPVNGDRGWLAERPHFFGRSLTAGAQNIFQHDDFVVQACRPSERRADGENQKTERQLIDAAFRALQDKCEPYPTVQMLIDHFLEHLCVLPV